MTLSRRRMKILANLGSHGDLLAMLQVVLSSISNVLHADSYTLVQLENNHKTSLSLSLFFQSDLMPSRLSWRILEETKKSCVYTNGIAITPKSPTSLYDGTLHNPEQPTRILPSTLFPRLLNNNRLLGMGNRINIRIPIQLRRRKG